MFRDIVEWCKSTSRLKVLKFFILQPEFRTTATLAATTMGMSKEVVARELSALRRHNLVVSKKQGKNVMWSGNGAHPYSAVIKVFLEQTTLPNNKSIAKAFHGLYGITLVVAAGVLASEVRGSVDLLIVTKNPHEPRLPKAVRKIEILTGLPLRYTILETKNYGERLEARDRLLRDMFEFSHRVVIDKR